VEVGHKMAQQIHEEALIQAKSILTKAQRDIANEMVKAKSELKKQIVNIVIQATQKLISEKMDTEKDKKLIVDFVDTL